MWADGPHCHCVADILLGVSLRRWVYLVEMNSTAPNGSVASRVIAHKVVREDSLCLDSLGHHARQKNYAYCQWMHVVLSTARRLCTCSRMRGKKFEHIKIDAFQMGRATHSRLSHLAPLAWILWQIAKRIMTANYLFSFVVQSCLSSCEQCSSLCMLIWKTHDTKIRALFE